jgi:hypothetical protein
VGEHQRATLGLCEAARYFVERVLASAGFGNGVLLLPDESKDSGGGARGVGEAIIRYVCIHASVRQSAADTVV